MPVSPSGFPVRYRSLDLWRGIACLAVIVYHACLTDHGFARWVTQPLFHGVTIFFVISGYCIAAASSRATGGADYFLRRLRRIFPPYWALILGSIAFFATLAWFGLAHHMTDTDISAMDQIPAPWSMNPAQWFGNLTLTETWRFHVAWRGGQRYFLGHVWTLGYEEQFYAVMGLLLLCRVRLGAGVAAVSLLVAALARWAPPGFFFDGYWLLFAAGAAVFYWRDVSPWKTIPAFCGLLVLAVAARPGLTSAYLLGLGFVTLLVILRPWDAALIASPWLQWLDACGLRCYSIYLVHYPITRFLSHAFPAYGAWFSLLVITPICIALSLLIAWPFHAYVERPFMSARQKRNEVAPATVPA